MAYSYGAPLTAPESRYRDLARLLSGQAANTQITSGGYGGLAQMGGAIAQAISGQVAANKADKERQAAVDRGYDALEKAGLDPQRLQLARAMGDPGLEWAFNTLTDPGDTELVQVVENGKKVWKNKSEAAGLQSDFPEAGKTRERIEGGTVIQEEYDPATGQWARIGSGPRFKGSEVSPTMTVWDPTANGGKGAKVYAGGPYKGQMAENPNRTTPNPSAYTEKVDKLTSEGFAATDAAVMALGGDTDQYESWRPTAPPTTDTGEIDPDQLDTDTRYLIGGSIYRWDGAQFVPYS